MDESKQKKDDVSDLAVDWRQRYRHAVKLLESVGVRELREDTAKTMTISGWLIDAGLSSHEADSLADRIGVLYGE